VLRRLWLSLRRDMLINLVHGYFWVVVGMAIVYVLLVRFVIPEGNHFQSELLVVDTTQEQVFAQYVMALAEDQGDNARIIDSVTALRAELTENENTVGVVLYAEEPLPAITLYFQGHHGNRIRRLMAVSTEDNLRHAYGVPRPDAIEIDQEVLDKGHERQASFRDIWVPVLLFSDPALFGLILIATLIFVEKDQGTIYAHMVTPGHIWEYLLSKALAMGLLAVLLALILVPLTLGIGPNYAQLVLIMLVGGTFTALLGAWFSVRFDNINQFLMPAALLSSLASLPTISYIIPSFSQPWVRWIPTYPLAMGLREAVFPSGNRAGFYTSLGTLILLTIACLLLASHAYKKHITR